MPKKDFDWGSITYEGDVEVAQSPGSRKPEMRDEPGTFKLIRVVADLKVTRRNSKEPLDPPASVQIKVSPDDIRTAGGIEKLEVAYWRNRWVPLPVKKRDAASITVDYDKNGDPPVGVGTR